MTLVELPPSPTESATTSRMFSRSVISELAVGRAYKILPRVIEQSGLLDVLPLTTTLRDFYDIAYRIIDKHYRNEYFYKNTLANRILLGRHSLNTAAMLSEFRVGNTKADIVIVNGTSNVYEIKTEFDSFQRLDNQISNYRKVFEHINVVTSEGRQESVAERVRDDIGIFTIDSRHNLRTFRPSASQSSNLESIAIFESLQKKEYLSIIRSVFGEIPNVPNTLMYRECRSLFSSLDPKLVHKHAVGVLRKRNRSGELAQMVTKLPSSLVAAVISYGPSNKETSSFLLALDNQLRYFLQSGTV